MEKQFLEMDVDPTTLVCVNPYEVNPVIVEKNVVPAATLRVDVPLKDEFSAIPQRHWDTSYGGGFYKPQRKIKLEMEEFGDLSSYLPKPMNPVDELNTPIFDKDAFDFNVNVYPKDSQSEDIFVKLESDAIYGNTPIITDNNKFKDFPLSAGKLHQHGNINSDISNMILQHPEIHNIYSGNENMYSCKISPSFENTNPTVYNVDDNSALSVNRQFIDVSSNNERFQKINSGLETPEDSNSSISHESATRPSYLSINTDLKPTAEANLTTPSIIEEVVNLETDNFNILDLVNEDITFVNAEDIFPDSFTSTTSDNISATKEKHIIPQKRPRKRRTYSEDDEDYVPPVKKNVVERRKIIKDDSESDSDVDFKPKTKTRGRPPKRTESVSSDCSKDSDVSKYRELRDKNNEASRKSRLKRKIKELEIEKEADQLLCKNIKLKAQVEELEKMVTNFRDNLFKIMIKK